MFKYLDVLIGLALVMVLVSPMVTAVTQMTMWIRNRRTIYLQQMLFRLIKQFGNSRAVRFEVTESGQPVDGIELVTANGTSLGTSSAGGFIFCETLPAKDIEDRTLTFQRRRGTAVATCQVDARFIPQASIAPVTVTAPPAGDGTVTVKHKYISGPALASRKATLAVTAPDGKPITTTHLAYSLNKGAKLRKDFTGKPIEIDLPAVGEVPFEYEFQFELKDALDAPVTAESVEITFVRFEGADRHVGSSPVANRPSYLALSVPGGMDDALALTLARAVAKHPLLARGPVPEPFPKVPPFRNRDAEVVEREQLIRVLLELAAADGEASLNPEDRARLRDVLRLHGIPDPAGTLSNVRAIAQQLEDQHPAVAAHVRNTQAIIRAAQSDFVGKINHWFDPASARATQQYAAEARFITIGAAFLVAMAIQLDALGLLQRLSSDSELRNALVTEAEKTQERITKSTAAEKTAAEKAAAEKAAAEKAAAERAATAKTAADKAAADKAAADKAAAADKTAADAATDVALDKAKLEEIERNLAILRSPSFALVPDHFAWQRLHRGRLERNPLWTSPYPANLYLLAGGTTYTVPVRWRRDALADIKAAIDSSAAPVRTAIEPGGTDLVVRGDSAFELHAFSGARNLPMPAGEILRARLNHPAVSDPADWQQLELKLDETTYPLPPVQNPTSSMSVVEAIRASRAPVVTRLLDAPPAIIDDCETSAALYRAPIELLVPNPGIRRVELWSWNDKAKRSSNLLDQAASLAGHTLAVPLGDVAQAVFDADLAALPRVEFTGDRPVQLIVDAAVYKLTIPAPIPTMFANLAKAIAEAKTGITTKCFTHSRIQMECSDALVAARTTDPDRAYFLEMTAANTGAREIRLLWRPDDPFSNVLNDATRVARTWRIPSAALGTALGTDLILAAGQRAGGYDGGVVLRSRRSTAAEQAREISRLLANTPVRGRAIEYSGDDLVITAKRLGPVQLRLTAGQADSNILNGFEESTFSFIEMFSRSYSGLFSRQAGLGGPSKDSGLFGILVTWVLLSLGAPFWYDALKNLLKLRPTAATTEERNRSERAETRSGTTTGQTSGTSTTTTTRQPPG